MAIAARPASAGNFDLGEDLAQIEDVEALSLSELLEQPTEAASRYARRPADSPSVVSTVDADMIERLGYRTLSEALQNVRGVHVGNDRNYSYIGVRGFSVPGDFNTRIALSIDGHRINDPVYGQATSGGELGLPMIAVERIELLRGGAWSVYGQNALLAAIHVVTATGASRPGLRVASTTRATAETHSDPAARPAVEMRGEDVSASYGAVVGDTDVFVAGNYQYDPGLSRLYMPGLAVEGETCLGMNGRPRSCDGVIEGYDAEEVGSVYAAIRGEHLSVRAFAAQRRKLVSTAAYRTIIGDRMETIDRRVYADIDYKLESRRADLIARVAFDRYIYLGWYPYDLGSSDGALSLPDTRAINRDITVADSVSAEVRGRYKRERLGRYLRDLEVAGSVEVGRSWNHQENFYDLRPEPMVLVDRDDPGRTLALAAHVNGRAVGHVVGFAAARADLAPGPGKAMVLPQAGLVIDGGEVGRIRASLGRGFRAPNVYERYYGAFERNQVVNPGLRPEWSQTIEVSAERYLDAHVRVLAVVFHQSIHDLIGLTTTADGRRMFDNVEAVDAAGAEAAVDARWRGMRVHAHLSRQRVTEHSGGPRVNAPQTLGGVSMLVPFAGGRCDLALEGYFVGERRLLDDTRLPLQTTVNAAVTLRDALGELDVTLGVTNLLDQRKDSPGSEEHRQAALPGEPRTVWLRLALDLGGAP